MKNTILPVFAALSLAIAPAAFASDKFEIDFDYSTVEVATAEGAEKIYSDLEARIENECEPAGPAFQRQRQRVSTSICVDRAIGEAVAQMQEPEVTKVHETKRG